MDTKQAKKIMGKNFIGPEELKKINFDFPVLIPDSVPEISFNLDKLRKDYIMIFGISRTKEGEKLTINKMRSIFGWDPKKSEPCFYNQDWYLREDFAKDNILEEKWYLIKKTVEEESRGKSPEEILNCLKNGEELPTAILTAFTFFSYYLLNNGEILWKNDFIWCSDKDANGDRVYTGRYIDPKRINKNGFNVHRYLSIRSYYGVVPQIKI